jgi:hypothetical protein
MKIGKLKVRPVALMGEVVLGALAIILAIRGAYTEAGAIGAIIGLTMQKAVESEEKGE